MGVRETKPSFFMIRQQLFFVGSQNDKSRLMADNSHQGPAPVTDFDRPADSSY